MRIHCTVYTARRGGILPLTAILLIPIMALCAFAVDLGYIIMARAELQNAADAAALAAAERLEVYYVQYYLPSADQSTILSNAKTAAKDFAQKYAGFHKAGSASSVKLDTTNDVKFGYMDNSTAYTTTIPSGSFPNTVEVTLRLDGGTNTNPQLGLFFGNVLGMGQTTVTATARATIYTGDFSDFNAGDTGLLPATLDAQVWDSFVATGKGSLSDFSYTAPTSSAPSTVPLPAVGGAPQILVVPDPNGRPGGWNYLSLDSTANSNNDFKSWFSVGMSQNDLNLLHSGGQLPLPAQPSDPTKATYFWKGAPGDRGNSEPFPAAGSVRVLPLYNHVPTSQSGSSSGNGNGNGNNPVSVSVDVNGNGNGNGNDNGNSNGNGNSSVSASVNVNGNNNNSATPTYIASDKNKGTWDGKAGEGQNSWFNISRFVGVVVTDNSNGLNVQPAAVSDSSITLTNIQPATAPASGQIKTFFAAPKLTY